MRANFSTVRLLMEMLDHNLIQFPTLIHGLQQTIYDMRRNNFQRILQQQDSLSEQISELEFRHSTNEIEQKWIHSTLVRLNEAKLVLSFWFDVFREYHNLTDKKDAIPRLLPLCRQLIQLDENASNERNKLSKRIKRNKKSKKKRKGIDD